MTTATDTFQAALREQFSALKLHGLLAHSTTCPTRTRTRRPMGTAWEARERQQRALQRRLRAHGALLPLH